jgi:hypothetical protein
MNILLTNVRVNGRDLSEDGITDTMILGTNLTAETIAAAYRKEGSITFDECCAVPDEDVKFYLYEPCWLSESEEQRALQLAS